MFVGGFAEVYIHCDAIVCGTDETDEACDRSCFPSTFPATTAGGPIGKTDLFGLKFDFGGKGSVFISFSCKKKELSIFFQRLSVYKLLVV